MGSAGVNDHLGWFLPSLGKSRSRHFLVHQISALGASGNNMWQCNPVILCRVHFLCFFFPFSGPTLGPAVSLPLCLLFCFSTCLLFLLLRFFLLFRLSYGNFVHSLSISLSLSFLLSSIALSVSLWLLCGILGSSSFHFVVLLRLIIHHWQVGGLVDVLQSYFEARRCICIFFPYVPATPSLIFPLFSPSFFPSIFPLAFLPSSGCP